MDGYLNRIKNLSIVGSFALLNGVFAAIGTIGMLINQNALTNSFDNVAAGYAFLGITIVAGINLVFSLLCARITSD
jgi:hypothetical protein